MDIFYLIIFFILGLFMGMIYTNIGLRLPKHKKIFTLENNCDICHHKLSVLDMIPILSYLFLKKRCRYCRAKINDTYTCFLGNSYLKL